MKDSASRKKSGLRKEGLSIGCDALILLLSFMRLGSPMPERKAICVVCGKPAEIESYCESHWLEKRELFSIKPLKLQVCDKCGQWYDNKWHPTGSLVDVLKAAVKIKIKPVEGAEISGIESAIKIPATERPGRATAIVSAKGAVSPSKSEISRKKEVELSIRWAQCDDCVKLSGSYNEAILQLRGDRVEKALKMSRVILRGKHFGAEQLKEGFNLYVVHKADASKAARELKESGFEVKRSFKHVSQKKGKILYRDYYSIR
jgi:NMD protein affecting ribosome stability and mRNA decay